MSNSQPLLSPRNAILTAVALLVLVTLATLWDMARPNDSGGLRRNSFGTWSGGYRALFETLESLDVPVRRDFSPPSDDMPSDQTLLLIDSDPRLIQFGPRYLQSLQKWVESGGRLVVVPSHQEFGAGSMGSAVPIATINVLDALGVAKYVQLVAPNADEEFPQHDFSESSGAIEMGTGNDDTPSLDDFWSMRAREKQKARIVPIDADGELAALGAVAQNLSLPANGAHTLKATNDRIAGCVTAHLGKDDDRTMAVLIRQGRGELVVVSDPAILTNRFLAESDNSVFATHLLSPDLRPVVFDEFYHGTAVRGNALYLFTRPGFSTMGLAILCLIGAWVWRKAVFLGPPLSDDPAHRRGIGEYIDAMGNFFSRGPDSRRFVVHEVRDGVLRQLCNQMKLPLHTSDVATIVAAVARRDPPRAARLVKLIGEVDPILERPGEFPKSQFLPTVERLSACL